MATKPTTTTNRSISIIPSATSQAVEPKPTKAEIIEALTRIKIEEQDAAREKAKAAYEAQRDIVLDLALKHSADLPLSAIDRDVLQYSHDTIEVSFKFTLTPQAWGADREVHVPAPADLEKAWKKANQLSQAVPSYRYYRNEGERYREVRKEIAASLTRDSAGRVSRLLADIDSRAALTDLLRVVEAGTEKRIN